MRECLGGVIGVCSGNVVGILPTNYDLQVFSEHSSVWLH